MLGTYRPVDVVLSRSPLKGLKQDLLVRRLCHELSIERLFAICAPVVIDKALRQRSPQPSQERAASSVRIERATALPVALSSGVQTLAE
jgi:ribosomal protein L19